MIEENAGDDNVAVTKEEYVVEGNEDRLLKEDEPKPETKPEAEEGEEPAVAKEDDTDSEEVKKHRRGGFQKKIAKKDARIAELEAELAKRAGTNEAKPSESDTPAKASPKPDTDVEALIEQKIQQRETAKAWNAKADEARKTYDDYDDALAEFDDVPVRADISQAMLESDHGADIAYYLATHPDELDAINGKDVSAVKIGKAIARIESVIEGRKGKAAVKVTKSPPPPIAPVKKGSSAVFNPYSDDTDTDAYEEYRKRFNKRNL